MSVATESRPGGGGFARLVATPRRALLLAFAAGAAISVQAYINGRLGREFDSAYVAASINNLVALVVALAVVLATGALPRGLARMRVLGRPPLWQFTGGLAGAALVLVSAAAAPEVGVALLTVAIVCGSTGGSLPVDAAGLGPAGRRPVTAPRVAGVLLAVVATVLSAVGARGHVDVLLLTLALLAGVSLAVQSAANGRLAQQSGEPFLASLINTTVGFSALALVTIAVVAVVGVAGSAPGNPLLYLGGVCGAFVVVSGAAAVQTLGVLRLGLATVAGQMAGALAVDLIAPAPGETVTATTVIGVALTMVAVVISGRGQASAARAA
jgi:bacterial/archaeal transporter family-2 protein